MTKTILFCILLIALCAAQSLYDTFDVGQAASLTAKSRLTLRGNTSSDRYSANFQVYTSSDNYCTEQFFNIGHGNNGIGFDGYYSIDAGSWKGSYAGTAHIIYKYGNDLYFQYGTVAAAGNSLTRTTAMKITSAGAVEISYLKLGSSTSYLDTFYDTTFSATVTTSPGTYNVSTLSIRGTRIGNLVTLTLPSMLGTQSTSAGTYRLDVFSTIPSYFLPAATGNKWSVQVRDAAVTAGYIDWSYLHIYHEWCACWEDYAYFTVYASTTGASFTTGNNRGFDGAVTISYVI